MKHFFYLVVMFFLFGQENGIAQDANIIFLHHSTGRLIYGNGHVADSVKAFNVRNGTNYSITQRSFPDKPYAWANYPYDYWNIWINGYCNEQKNVATYASVACLEDLCPEYDIIILKHCYPGADILEDIGKADIGSSRKSMENYKLQYRALREKFQEFPENDFIVWTLAPRHRLVTSNPMNAPRAKEFVDWVKNEWLTENGRTYSNIHIFDFFSLSAEMDTRVSEPRVPYCLRYEYELSHDDNDSHPNQLASKEIGPEFYRFIMDVAQKRQNR